MAKDFQTRQLRTTQIIGSGGIGSGSGGSSIGLLIYSSSDASNLSGGMTHNMTASAGTDVWMFVSGANEGKSKKSGVVLFGGDVVVSGVLYADKQVIEVEESTTGSLSVSGSLFVSRSFALGTRDPEALAHFRRGGQTSSGKPLEMLRLEIVDEGVDMDAGQGPAIDFYVGETGGSNYGGTVAVVKEENSDSDSDAAMVFHTATDDQVPAVDREKMRITSAGRVGIGITDPAAILEARGNIISTGFVSASMGLTGSLTTLCDGKSFIEAGSNITVASASNGAITISAAGGGRSVSGDTDNGVITWVTSDDTFTVESNLTFDGTDLGVSDKILHVGDTDTFINFTPDEINIQAGGVDFIKIEEDTTNSIIFNEGAAAVDFRVETSGEDEALFVDGTNNALYINKGETAFVTAIANTNDNAVLVNAAGVIFNEDGHATNDFRVESDSNAHAIFVDAGNNGVLLGADSLPGSDVFAFISGSTGDHSSGTANRGTTLIGGDLVTSGAMYGKQLEYTYHCYNRSNGDAVFIGWYNNNEATGNIDDVQGVMPFSGRPVRVIVRAQNDLGLTVVGFHKSTAGTMYCGTTPIESISNISSADATPVAFDFTVTGSAAPTARFSAGDVVAISINPTEDPGDVNVTCIWELTTHRIISGSAL